MKKWCFFTLFTFLLVSLNGCSSRPPTIAHTHVGHMMTGWHDTPDKMGLFSVAQITAHDAVKYADNALKEGKNLNEIKTEIKKVINATDPQGSATSGLAIEAPYGLKQALMGSIDHFTFAATSNDASPNVQASSAEFAKKAAGVLDRCDLLTALSEGVLASTSPEEAVVVAQEVRVLTYANLEGIDSDGNGEIGDTPEELGIKQLDKILQNMIQQEDPPYTTVDSWYLFNIIRLPSGLWVFKSRHKDHQGTGYGSRSNY